MHDTLEKIDSGWREWIGALDQVDGSRREEAGVCGYWSVKDLVAHLPFWERMALDHIHRWTFGLPRFGIDVEIANQANYLANHDRHFDLLYAEMAAQHEVTRQAVLGIEGEPDDDLRKRVADDTWDHYPEHTHQVVNRLEGKSAR